MVAEPEKKLRETADGINHAVPTQKEINASLRWLKKHGLVCEKGGRFLLTGTGKTLFRKIQSQALWKRWDAVLKAIENI